MMGKTRFNNFVEILKYRAKEQSNKIAFTFLVDGEDEEVSITYSEMNMRAESIAAELKKTCFVGDRALLMFPSGLDFISAFFGCLYAGVIAVPAYPPKKNRKMGRLHHILNDCNAKTILSAGKTFDNAYNSFNKNDMLKGFNWIKVDDIENVESTEFTNIKTDPDQLTFIQYTSGSTGSPKGVMVSHENLIENSLLIYNSLGYSSKTIMVSWLPLFHDMGLVGGMFQSMFGGFHIILMAPESFLLKPIRWLKVISKYKATATGAPNFAYELCNNIKEELLTGIDIGSLKVAYCGAEPINAETVTAFSNKMKSIGFNSKAFYPCYGMAEATVFIAGSDFYNKPTIIEIDKEKIKENKFELITDKTDPKKQIVSCGYTGDNHKVIIVDPNTKTICKNGEVGEIWFSGKSVAQGYWKKEDLNKEIFHSYTSDTNSGPFLRTGDLGVLQDQELYITGRLKDVIIIRGRNHYPQDIEYTVSKAHETLVKGGTAAFSIESDGEEKLIVIQEIKRVCIHNLNAEEVFEIIKRAVVEEHELQIHDIILIRPMRLLKTSSGKVQRKGNKKAYLENTFEDTVARMLQEEESKSIKLSNSPKYKSTEIHNLITAKITNFLKIPTKAINVNASFESFGLDSLKAIRLIGELSEEIGKDLSPTLVYDYPSIASLSNYLEKGKEEISSCSGNINSTTQDIAIIGMSCRFPGAEDINSFWELLINGRDAITEIPTCRRKLVAGKQSKGGYLTNIDKFDADLFSISPKEAKLMDPQQRILMEESYSALLAAGIVPSELAGSNTGVFVGISQNDYSYFCLKSKDNDSPYLGTGSALSIAANRLSYFYDLKGPSMAVNTACSSSLVALHLAINSLRHVECNMALVAGVNLNLTDGIVKALNNANMLASDSYCKTFDASADGYVRSEGCGVVVLKPVTQCLKDKDNIQAVIKGSAIVQDGRSNGLSAPNGIAQQEVIRKALKNARLEPKDIHFIETHGTGTKLGDPIEIGAISEVFGKHNPQNKLLVGAVKANIGHLESAAGIAGLIKSVLCLQNKKIPKQLHFNTPNPHINWADIPIEVPTELTPILDEDTTLKAGISSFGFGGMNAHVIIEEAPLISDSKDNSLLKNPLSPYSFQRKSYWVEQDIETTNIKGSNKENILFDLLQEGKMKAIEKLLKDNGTLETKYFNYLPAILNALIKSMNIGSPHRPISNLFYQFQWKLKLNLESISNFPKGHYLIFSDTGGLGEKLAKKLQDQDCGYSLVYHSNNYRKLDSGKYQINSTKAQDFRQLLNDVQKNARLPISHVIYLWSTNIISAQKITPSTLKSAQVFGCDSVLYLIQSLISQSITPKIWLFTRSTQLVTRKDEHNLATSPIWGLGKVIPLEHPQLPVSIVDLDRQASKEEQIVQQLIANNPKESHITIRNEQIYTGRLVKSIPEPKKSIHFDSKATYIITGGLGALGLHTANWMANNGVKNLILISRRKPTASKIATLNSLRETGVQVKAVQADICDFSEISKVFKMIDDKVTPLKGIIHAAGVEETRLIKHMELDHMSKVMNPKVIGSWNLHELTKIIDIDFFIMFSSISSVWGAAGHAHYAAGNYFLDSLASYRKSHGLPATTVNWGPWEGGGMADKQKLVELEKRGVGSLSPEQGMEALKYLMEADCTNSVIADIEWDKFKQLYEIGGQIAFFEEIETKTTEISLSSSAQKPDILTQIETAPKNKQIFLLTTFLQKEVAKVLEFDEGELPDLDKGFTEMGIDSLMAVDLKSRLEECFNTNYPITIVFEYPNINSLANYIAIETLNLETSQKEVIEEKINLKLDQQQPINAQLLSEKDAEDLINKELDELIS